MIGPIAAALLMQNASLVEDRRAAAITCMAVLSAQDAPADLDWFVTVNYLTLVAASARGQSVESGTAGLAEAVQAEKSALVARERSGVLQACRARFPLAWSSLATLPQDRFERRLLCSTFAGVYEGLLDTIAVKVDVSTERSRVRRKSAHLGDLVTNADAAAHGLGTQAKLYAAVQDVVRKSIAYGNVRALNGACEAAFPS